MILEIDENNDLKFRGPLTYQHLRIIAWVCLAIAQIAVFMNVAMKVNKDLASTLATPQFILSLFSDLATPLFLIANFAIILSARDGYKKLFIRFGALSGAVLAAFMFLYEHYVVGLAAQFTGERGKAHEVLAAFLHSSKGFIAFNLFLDLFLCTLVMYFLMYRPKRVFVGKKLIIFRLFALLPMIYEGVSITLKILASSGSIALSPFVYPFLTTKPPLEFVFFIALALFIKRRERKFLKNGKTQEEYNAFLETRTNSWHFSVHAAIIIAVTVVIDFVLLIFVGILFAREVGGALEAEEALTTGLLMALTTGFGQSIVLLFALPLVLLFSYNREPKHPKINTFVPLAGVGLIVFIYIEGIYQVLCVAVAHYKDVLSSVASEAG